MQSISPEQNITAVENAILETNKRFDLVGIKAEACQHRSGKKYSFVHSLKISCATNIYVQIRV